MKIRSGIAAASKRFDSLALHGTRDAEDYILNEEKQLIPS